MENDNFEPIIAVNDADFDEKVIQQSEKMPVAVDFWAAWCMPCLALGPILEGLVEEYKGKFILAKLNVDENPLTSRIYGIRGIPAVKMFKGGLLADEFVGALPEPAVRQWIEKNIKS
ncbi:MAG: thiol reductase thioredoxin [Candidatus Diapherotrites archaeon]|nr:thiol reductase thioredoxin [Candidatus Diapherotrites archaeon]